MQNWLLPAARRVATSREALRDVPRVNIRTRCSQLLNWRKDRGGLTRGKEPRSEIVNTFSHSPIFRATTAQPLVKNHASSRLPRIGAPPFRRPLRHSIVRFRAPTTPESRERNDHALCIGACCSPMALAFRANYVYAHPGVHRDFREHIRSVCQDWTPSRYYCVYVNRTLYQVTILTFSILFVVVFFAETRGRLTVAIIRGNAIQAKISYMRCTS